MRYASFHIARNRRNPKLKRCFAGRGPAKAATHRSVDAETWSRKSQARVAMHRASGSGSGDLLFWVRSVWPPMNLAGDHGMPSYPSGGCAMEQLPSHHVFSIHLLLRPRIFTRHAEAGATNGMQDLSSSTPAKFLQAGVLNLNGAGIGCVVFLARSALGQSSEKSTTNSKEA